MSKKTIPVPTSLLISEVHHFTDQMKLIRVGIYLGNKHLQIIEEICKIRQDNLNDYVRTAVNNQIARDLETPSELGSDYCQHLKRMLEGQGNTDYD